MSIKHYFRNIAIIFLAISTLLVPSHYVYSHPSITSVSTDSVSMTQSDIQELKYNIKNNEELLASLDKRIYPYGLNNYEKIDTREEIAVRHVAKYIELKHSASVPRYTKLKAQLKHNDDYYIVWEDGKKYNDIEYVVIVLRNRWNAWPSGSLGKAIQTAAQQSFNLPDAYMGNWKNDELGSYEKFLPEIRYVLEGMHDYTTKFFKSKGIDQVIVYRGLSVPYELKGNVNSHVLSPLSSFSLRFATARNFAYSWSEGYPYVLAKKVPVERILSLGPTGLGTFWERELVVIGSNTTDYFFINPGTKYKYEEGSPLLMKKPLNTPAKFNKWVDHGLQKIEGETR